MLQDAWRTYRVWHFWGQSAKEAHSTVGHKKYLMNVWCQIEGKLPSVNQVVDQNHKMRSSLKSGLQGKSLYDYERVNRRSKVLRGAVYIWPQKNDLMTWRGQIILSQPEHEAATARDAAHCRLTMGERSMTVSGWTDSKLSSVNKISRQDVTATVSSAPTAGTWVKWTIPTHHQATCRKLGKCSKIQTTAAYWGKPWEEGPSLLEEVVHWMDSHPSSRKPGGRSIIPVSRDNYVKEKSPTTRREPKENFTTCVTIQQKFPSTSKKEDCVSFLVNVILSSF